MELENTPERLDEAVRSLRRLVDVAGGREPADLVLKNATYVNVFTDELCTVDIAIAEGRIAGLGTFTGDLELDVTGKVVTPGFIDPHIHLESSMAMPAEFAKAVLPHGTTAVVADPHEIVNVMGEDGFELMLQATEGLPFDAYFTLPSCVPATPLDENGADLDYVALSEYLEHPRVMGLAEMMDYTGVVQGSEKVLERIALANLHCRPVDGHAPGLRGTDLCAYVATGIYSDHECSTLDEALEKMRLGMHVMVREGTAARNLAQLASLVEPLRGDRLMFCCDDKHPSDLLEHGHIDLILRRAVAAGADPLTAVRVATHNPALYFGLKGYGAVACGYRADLAIMDNLRDFNVSCVIKGGQVVYINGSLTPFERPPIDPYLLNRARTTFNMPLLEPKDLLATQELRVLGVVPGEITTTRCGYANRIDTQADVLKIAVAERHRNTGHVGLGYIHGFGLQRGAIATSVSHDSHNIIAVGANEDDMAAAVNHVARNNGGIAVVDQGAAVGWVPLGIAGVMSEEPLEQINDALEAAKATAHAMGVHKGVDPFMTLAFMSLTVIPTLRITTHGVYDVEKQSY